MNRFYDMANKLLTGVKKYLLPPAIEAEEESSPIAHSMLDLDKDQDLGIQALYLLQQMKKWQQGGSQMDNHAQAAPVTPLIPDKPTVLIGRDEAYQTLRQRLKQGGILAIDGRPGLGKSTLAKMLVHDPDLQQHFTGGILWISIGMSANTTDVLNRCAEAFGIDTTQELDNNQRINRIRQQLQQQPFLWVLDDVRKHSEVVDLLCKLSIPGCAHLLTCRDHTVVSSLVNPAHCLALPSLDKQQSIALLNALCPACTDKIILQRLVQVANGLPLSLALIAGYLTDNLLEKPGKAHVKRVLKAAELWLGITERARPRNLEEIIYLSIKALPDDNSRQAFIKLAGFASAPDHFSADAALLVAGIEQPLLDKLLRRQLLQQTSQLRISVHAQISSCIQQRARQDELLDKAQALHAHYYLQWANRYNHHWRYIAQEWRQIWHGWHWVLTENDEWIVEYAGALDNYLRLRGQWLDSFSWLEQALAAARRLQQPNTEAMLLNGIGLLYNQLGDSSHALNFYQQALTLFGMVNNQADQAATLNNIGQLYDNLGDKQQALRFYEQALPISRQAGDKVSEVISLNNIGLIHHNSSEKQDAIRYYEDALRIIRELDDRAGEAVTLNNLGLVYDNLGDKQQALRYYKLALPIRREVGDKAGEAVTLNNIGLAYHNLGERQEALHYYEQALPLIRQLDDGISEATTLNNMGLVYRNLGETEQALAFYELALPIRRAVGDRVGEAVTLNNIGLVYQNQGDRQRALSYYEQALPIRREVGDRVGEAVTLNNIGRAYHNSGDKQQALDWYQQALPIIREVGDRAGEAVTLNNIGQVYDSLNDKQQALSYYQQALPIIREIGNPLTEAITLDNMGQVYDGLGDRQQALLYYQLALAIRQETGDSAGEAVTLNNIGLTYHKLEADQHALAHFERALLISQQLADQAGQANTLFNISKVYQSAGDLNQAIQALEQVVAIEHFINAPGLESDKALLAELRGRV